MPKNCSTRPHSYDALMRYARMLGFGEIHTKTDPESGLACIIAVHSNTLGPAIGGCRFIEYDAHASALKDVLRLASMMTIKAAVCGLPHGGAKAVILKPKTDFDREALFSAFGEFVHELNGRYITAIDVGSTMQDMDRIAQHTPFVINSIGQSADENDPSPHTAYGVLRSLQAAVQFSLGKDSLDGLHVAIQGAGHVGFPLARHLHALGARITICDPNTEATQRCKTECNATVVAPEAIYDVPCDVFAPCALGGTINLANLKRLQCSIVVGSANNQLAHRKYAQVMHERDILYAPDFVANAGGLIYAAMLYNFRDPTLADEKIDILYDTSLAIFERAKQSNQNTVTIAESIAMEHLQTGNAPLERQLHEELL